MNREMSEFFEMVRRQGAFYNQSTVILGEVINPLPDMKIVVNGIQIDKDDMYIADYMVQDVHYFKKGDLLAINPIDNNQQYIVLCRVVRLA